MSSRVSVKPEVLRWARIRSGRAPEYLENTFKKLSEWENGSTAPTYKQLKDFAKATYTPFGYLFLDKPPEEKIPIPDFRTLSGTQIRRPSPNLLDTIYTMQQRSEWLSETQRDEGVPPLHFVGSAKLNDPPQKVANEIRSLLGLEDTWADQIKSWKEAVSKLKHSIEGLGILTVINGVLGNNTHRKLDVQEFRGFALCDKYAPLIFVNGVDSESAKVFTLAHELAHIWVGKEGLSGFEGVIASNEDSGDEEKFCDAVAAEFLLPENELIQCWHEIKRQDKPYNVLAKKFKISPIVAARRVLDLKLIGRKTFFEFYHKYTAEENHKKKRNGDGGDFYRNQNYRIGKRFGLEIIRAAKEGRLSFRDAYRMTGLEGKTFKKYGRYLGFNML